MKNAERQNSIPPLQPFLTATNHFNFPSTHPNHFSPWRAGSSSRSPWSESGRSPLEAWPLLPWWLQKVKPFKGCWKVFLVRKRIMIVCYDTKYIWSVLSFSYFFTNWTKMDDFVLWLQTNVYLIQFGLMSHSHGPKTIKKNMSLGRKTFSASRFVASF